MSDCIPDILCVNETRLDKSISDNIIKIHGYVCIRKDRNRNGGGVSVYIREIINFRSRSELKAESLEAVCIEIIKPNSKPFAVIACYRPPNSPLDFFDQLESVVDTLDSEDKEIILIGDLNCNTLATSADNTSY